MPRLAPSRKYANWGGPHPDSALGRHRLRHERPDRGRGSLDVRLVVVHVRREPERGAAEGRLDALLGEHGANALRVVDRRADERSPTPRNPEALRESASKLDRY